MNETTTVDTTCQICQDTIERVEDMIYVLWDGKAENLSKPNHKTCAAERYERNRRLANGYVQCDDCGKWVFDFQAENGLCSQCASLVDEFQGEAANLY